MVTSGFYVRNLMVFWVRNGNIKHRFCMTKLMFSLLALHRFQCVGVCSGKRSEVIVHCEC